ncbi:hypothetical protein Lser_V15G24413 [Lactuca serriola]
MAASLFTFSSTSRRLVPAQNSPPLPIYIKATNVVFNPDIPDVHRGLGLDDFVNFLVSCRLRYAISDVPSEFFPEQVCEFYYTATINDENNVISGTIGRGRHSVFIIADLLSVALRLPIFEPFSELPPIERCRRLFDQLGYDHSKAGTRSALILRQCMTPGWKFFTGALCKCVGHKSRSGDQLSTYEQQVVCSLLLNKRLDYGAFFFDQLVQLLRANVHADHVPFPCWIALVLDKFFAEAYYSHSGNPIQCPRMSIRMYQDDPLETDIGTSNRMREWIANPYTVPSLTADTDEGADGNNEDHADQEVESQMVVISLLNFLIILSLSLRESRCTSAEGDTDDDPKEGDTEYVELGSADNTLVQTESPQPMHESDTEEPDRPADTEKLAEDSEHDDEHDDECQMLDMKFIDPIIPVQGEDSDVASEDTQPLSRKRKAADTELASSHTDTSLLCKKPKSIVSISNLATEWNMSPDQVKQILDEANQAQLLKNIAQADESLIQHQLQVKGSFEAQMQKFLEYQSEFKSSQPPPSNSKSRTENVLDRIDRKRFQDVLKRRVSSDKIIKVKASKPRNEKILTLLITRQGPQHPYTEVVKRDELIRYGYSEWMELLELASRQTSALSSELICALRLLIKKVQRLDLVPIQHSQQQGQSSSVPRFRRTKFQVDGEDVLVLNFGAEGIINSLPISVESIQHKFISVPEHGMFYLDKNKRMCFHRTTEIPRAPTAHLVGLRQMYMSHQDLSGEFHILTAMELLNRRQELLDSPYWPVKIEAEAEYEEFLSRGVLV